MTRPHQVLAALSTLLLLGACGRVGYGSLSDGGGAHPDSSADSAAADTGAFDASEDSAVFDSAVFDSALVDSAVVDGAFVDGTVGLACADENAGRTVGTGVVAGDNSDADDAYAGCGSSREDFVAWTPPATGLYNVVVASAAFAPMLGILMDDCAGAEVACDGSPFIDIGSGTSSSRVLGNFTADNQVVLVVSDALADAGGAYTVDIEAVTCSAAMDVGTSTATITGSTATGDRWFEGSCGAGRAPEATIRFEAPNEGFFEFDTVGSSFDTVLYVRDGDCSGVELACNDDRPGGGGTGMTVDPTSAVTVRLNAGQVVFVAVDGAGSQLGDYRLEITDWGLGS